MACLRSEAVLHEAAYSWGKGFVVTDRTADGRRRSHRFDAPTELTWRSDGVDLGFRLPGLTLDVDRTVAGTWDETYALHNTGDEPVSVGSLA